MKIDKLKAKKIVLRTLLALGGLLVILAVSAEMTSRPSFCPTCHYMEPFYESWKTSSHNDVTCVKCHFPPGLAGTVRGKVEGLVQVVNYLARSYTRRRPWAEISDASCLQSGCHETRLLQGKVIFKGVVFDHKDHLGDLRRGKKLRCTSCHSQIVQGEHMIVTETTCFLCHFKAGPSVEPATFKQMSRCTTCHHWESIPPEKMKEYRYDHTNVIRQNLDCNRCHYQTIIGDGYVPKENCFGCHFEPERVDKYEDITLVHKIHITDHKLECIRCHLQIQHKVQKLSASAELECVTCHNATHSEQLMLFTGKEFNGVKGIPNPMHEAGLTCASCHIFHENLMGKAEVKKARPQSCEYCHGKGYGQLLKLWEETADRKLKRLKQAYSQVKQAVQHTGAASRKDIQERLQKVEYGIHLIEVGKAIHNIQYSDRILEASLEHLSQVIAQAGLSINLPRLATRSAIPGECANCHSGIEEIRRDIFGVKFWHQPHLQKANLTCTVCHSNARVHGELVISREKCSSCHHRSQAEATCQNCHGTEYQIFTGTFAGKDMPDIMQQAEVTCTDCHQAENRIVRPDISICASCHDEDYTAMGQEWQEETRNLLNELKTMLATMPEGLSQEKQALVEQIKQQLSDLEKHSAEGVHNHEMTIEILTELKTKLEQIQTPS